jgi:hypothetical protein
LRSRASSLVRVRALISGFSPFRGADRGAEFLRMPADDDGRQYTEYIAEGLFLNRNLSPRRSAEVL